MAETFVYLWTNTKWEFIIIECEWRKSEDQVKSKFTDIIEVRYITNKIYRYKYE